MKKVFLTTICMCAAMAANASYLYWQVSSADTSSLGSSEGNWNVARIVVASANDSDITSWNSGGKRSGFASESYVTENTILDDGTVAGTLVGVTGDVGSFAANIGSSLTGYAYYVELVNSSTGYVYARSNAEAYSAISSHITADLEVVNVPSASLWHASGYTVIPEPTSAILMLFGAAFLGLKRKNRRIA